MQVTPFPRESALNVLSYQAVKCDPVFGTSWEMGRFPLEVQRVKLRNV